jgi:5'-phosphate synthase pdxT subunit
VRVGRDLRLVNPQIGVLAVQGDYEAHAKALERLGVERTYVRRPDDLADLKVMAEESLWNAVKKFATDGGAFFGTCAGAILLAREVRAPAQDSLGLLDISILRNAYGRQLASEVRTGPSKLREKPLEMVFIRAPIIDSVGSGVEILAEDAGHPVLVQQGRILASTFHPELTDDPVVHEHFLRLIGE